MASLNSVILVGNTCQDVELRHTQNGTAVGSVTLGISDRKKVNDEWVDNPCFVPVTLWAQQAEFAAEYVKKGRAVLIEGRLTVDKWETAEGEKRSKMLVTASRIQPLSVPKGGDKPEAEPEAKAGDDQTPPTTDGTAVPF
jgi:single-strand DNA-binding protein